jgi:hypothetical protein
MRDERENRQSTNPLRREQDALRQPIVWTQDLEDQFQGWWESILDTDREHFPNGRNPNPDDPKHFYDSRGFWYTKRPPIGQAGFWNAETQSYHGADEWKQPGSPEDTFGKHANAYRPPAYYLSQLENPHGTPGNWTKGMDDYKTDLKREMPKKRRKK